MTDQKGPDPGWNDPPTFTYDQAAQIQTNALKKGNLLNKRVAYPLSGPPTPLSGGIDPTAPPQAKGIHVLGTPPMSAAPPISPLDLSSSNISECPENALEEIMILLNERMKIISSEQREEISKRLDMMKKLWVEEKLNKEVQIRLLELSKAVEKGDIVTADRLQKSLSVDHIAVCSSWMGGIRQLINLIGEQEEKNS